MRIRLAGPTSRRRRRRRAKLAAQCRLVFTATRLHPSATCLSLLSFPPRFLEGSAARIHREIPEFRRALKSSREESSARFRPVDSSSSFAIDDMIFRVTLLVVCALLAGARSEPRPRSRPVPIYSNQFAVYVPSGPETADEIAQEHGFDNHGQFQITQGMDIF
ncbi:Uncharacterized protein DBV15_00499, partial [Temnothorax longispinosus]